MRIKCYLVVNDRGTVRVTKNAPSVEWNEVPIQLQLDVPNGLFARPTFTASVTLPNAQPPVIPAEVVDRIEGVLERETGIKVELYLVEPEIKE